MVSLEQVTSCDVSMVAEYDVELSLVWCCKLRKKSSYMYKFLQDLKSNKIIDFTLYETDKFLSCLEVSCITSILCSIYTSGDSVCGNYTSGLTVAVCPGARFDFQQIRQSCNSTAAFCRNYNDFITATNKWPTQDKEAYLLI